MIIKKLADKITSEIKKAVIGQDEVIHQLIVAFFAGGHVIFEGVPGLAKTFLARVFANIIGKSFNRIQFTPDLMPTDIIGTNIFDLSKSEFVFKKGPIFTNILLGDEINRASPKTQSALLEIMQEKQVTVDGIKYEIDKPFMVIATQNPIEFEGTYPLPEAQLDRFFMKIIVDYPDENDEINVLKQFRDGFNSEDVDKIDFNKIDIKMLDECRKEFLKIKVEDPVIHYIMDIIKETRAHKALIIGASTRAGVHLLNVSKYSAALDGRDYVIPDDVKSLIMPVLRHRIILQADAEIEGEKADDIINDIIKKVKVPH